MENFSDDRQTGDFRYCAEMKKYPALCGIKLDGNHSVSLLREISFFPPFCFELLALSFLLTSPFHEY
jgi:hypothetical protein